jgi:diadenosine tetraphosphate (Ap4A) HIT family hydrolase
MTKCPSCLPDEKRIREASRFALFIDDGFPVSPGHALLIPRRHVQSLFNLDEEERNDLLSLLARARSVIQAQLQPDGFNIGINDGAAAGQTVMHLHVHLIPRFAGDRADPRGGVRWVIPEKADYWSTKS